MKELQDIVTAFDKAQTDGQQTALATVVHVEGSSYRRAGARMLITDDGQLTGAISGGCLEGDALRKARLVMAQGKSMLATYDTNDDDDAKFGVGLGCNGIIRILIEPIFPEKQDNPVALFKQFLSKRESAVLITLFDLNDRHAGQPGTCLLLASNAEQFGSLPKITFKESLLNDAKDVLAGGNSLTKTYLYADRFSCFIELLQPTVSLLIFGAGNDATPLTRLVNILGWHITLIDGRANYATVQRFPLVDRIIISKPEQALLDIASDDRTVAIMMTHNYNYDLGILRQLLSTNLPYLGALGPKKRLQRMLDELRDEGLSISEENLKNIYGPAGLDIGSDSSDEIALSILAEILAVLKNRNGISLRQKVTIHNREVEQIIQQNLTLINE